MKIPARCNKRSCQARRNLSKRPQFYVRDPKCHMPGCDGLMYVDEYRLKKGAKDNAPVCRDPFCGYLEKRLRAGGSFLPFHRISTEGCDHCEDYQLERLVAASKHCPNKAHGVDDECPF